MLIIPAYLIYSNEYRVLVNIAMPHNNIVVCAFKLAEEHVSSSSRLKSYSSRDTFSEDHNSHCRRVGKLCAAQHSPHASTSKTRDTCDLSINVTKFVVRHAIGRRINGDRYDSRTWLFTYICITYGQTF